jgi:hypothetical protein
LPQSRLALRMLAVSRAHPSFYDPIFRHLAKYPRLSPRVSTAAIDLLREFQLYPSFTAALLRTIESNTHPTQRERLYRFCRSSLTNINRNAELRAPAASCLIRNGAATWTQTDSNCRWARNWWVRTEVIRSVDISRFGRPGLETLCNALIRDTCLDVSIVATEIMLSNTLRVTGPLANVHPAAQRILRSAGVIGRVSSRSCFINAAVVEILGPQLRLVQWRKVFSRRGLYRSMLPRFSQWRAYQTTDATAWITLTDTINDVILESLFRHDTTIGTYSLGSIGTVLHSPTSRFATKYPRICAAVKEFHRLRLEADLSHSVTRSTNRPTRRIRFAELRRLRQMLGAAYADLWAAW